MIPLVDLQAQYQTISHEIEEAVLRVLRSCHYVLGPEVSAFEREFAAYCHTTHAIGSSNGTSALHLALLASGIGPGDEVITVPFTFVATVAAINYTGARPVFVDIDPSTFTIDVTRIEQAITPRTRALLPVHLYGHTADLDPIVDIAKRHSFKVIEDAAQAHGAEYKGRRAGSIGDFGCFSFYPGKNLGAAGEAGAVVTNSDEGARVIRMLRDWGQDRKYNHQLKGFNYRLEEIQAAVLRVKLRHLERWTIARRNHAATYAQRLDPALVALPRAAEWTRHVYHVYAVRSPRRDNLQQELERRNIRTGIHYPIPVHLQPAFADLGYKQGDFPQSERAAAEVLSLPMYAELTDTAIEQVASSIQEACASSRS